MRRVTYSQLIATGSIRDYPISGAKRVFIGMLNAAAVNVTGNYTTFFRTSGGVLVFRSWNTGPVAPAATYWHMLPDTTVAPIIPISDVLRVQPTLGNAWFVIHVDYED